MKDWRSGRACIISYNVSPPTPHSWLQHAVIGNTWTRWYRIDEGMCDVPAGGRERAKHIVQSDPGIRLKVPVSHLYASYEGVDCR